MLGPGEIGGDAQPSRCLDHLAPPDALGKLQGDAVEGAREGFAQGHPAIELAVVIVRVIAGDGDRAVVHHIARAHPRLHGGEIDEELEGGAGGPERLGRAVELAGAVIAPADHGPDRAIGRKGDQRRLAGILGRIGAGEELRHHPLCRDWA
jgi:hypothetical protein